MSDISIESAIRHIRRGENDHAYRIIRQVIDREPENVHAWAWLAYVTEDIEQKRSALRHAAALSPDDARIFEALERLNSPEHIRAAARRGVYISYARSDEMFAFNLANTLRSRGIRAWLDSIDIPDNADWYASINHALDRCGIMLAVLSMAALSAPDLHAEWRYYEDHGKLVLPLLTEDCDLPVQSLWLPPVDFREDYREGARQLFHLLGQDAAHQG